MKKINRNMRGFTLVEIMIVVAIILIISAVAFTSVAITLSNAQDKQDEVQDHAENFEEAARTEIRSLTVDVVDWTTIPKYTPRKKADREVASLKAFGWKDEEIEVTYGETGYVITKTWNPDLHDGKTYEEYLEEYNAAHNKTNNTSGNSQQGQGQQGQGQQGQGQQGQGQQGQGQQGQGQQGQGQQGQGQQGQGQQGQNQQGQNQQGNNPPSGVNVSVPRTVTGSAVGVKAYQTNSDGTTTLNLSYNGGNESAEVKIRNNGNGTYSLYIVNGQNPIGAVIGYNAENNYCGTQQWLNLPESQWNQLEQKYGFTIED